MARISTLLAAAAVAFTASPVAASLDKPATPICEDIETRLTGGSRIIYPLNAAPYNSGTNHWFTSSNQKPACVVEVGSVQDLSTTLKVVGDTRTPFAVMAGGHASNPGFSSTEGVHILLKRLNQVILSADKKTAEIGFGITWKEVFERLDGTGVNVVGGRTPGPAVGGFTLGGGFSWKTNQYGLSCDTVKSYNMVLPNGTFTKVTASSNRDLFFALKGGKNRFGVVTSAEFETHPQTDVWGGLNFYAASAVPALLNATAHLQAANPTNHKVAVITTLEGSVTGTSALLLFFHDGPERPALYDLFEDIPVLVKGVKKRSFAQLISSIPAPVSEYRNPRGAFHTISTSSLTQGFLDAVKAEADAVGKLMAANHGYVASFDIEPFTDYGRFATDSAYPHSDSPIPLNLYFSWGFESKDAFWHDRMRQSVATLKQVAIAEGIWRDSFTAYPNYALANATAAELYGPANAARLRAIRQRIDPDRVMDLTGGFTI